MTQTLPGADIRGYYAALGIQLPIWTAADVSVRCFADPEAHRRDDHDPSCSINLAHGAWNCHGCGASGGPYDAAIHQGCTSRTAIDLMIRHGLTQRRAPAPRQRQRQPSNDHRASICPRIDRPGPAARLTVTDADISRWRRALESDPDLIERLVRERGWELDTIHELELGVDRGRITIPVRDHRRRLVGLLRNRPWSEPGQIKMRAAVGSRRQLLPHPAHDPSHRILLVEGEPDMIAARSRRLPAIALPGVQSWRPEWASLFAERQVTIIMDADEAGRESAARINQDLRTVAAVQILDLAPDRNDGYDLTDWLLSNRPVAQAR
jgi:hypothetical protein